MSVATEFAPTVYIPSHYVPSGSAASAPASAPVSTPVSPVAAPLREPVVPARLASVTTLHRPSPRSVAAPVRLTHRGVVVLVAAVALVCVALVWLAWQSAPSAGAPAVQAPATVTVHAGDTLWSIASQVAPGRDPRAEVAVLQRLNHLDGVDLAAGQVLRTR